MKVIDETGFVHFRGDPKEAKSFFGNGTLVNEVYDDETHELITTEIYNLTIEYENSSIEYKQYLIDTDWYVIRQQETGTPIPDDITQKRQEARENT